MRSIEQLTEEVLALPSKQRIILVEKLLESLEFNIEPAVQSAWTTVAKQRQDEIRNGIVQPIRGEDALAEVRELLGQ